MPSSRPTVSGGNISAFGSSACIASDSTTRAVGWSSARGSAQQAGDDVDHHGDDHGAEEVREKGVAQHDPAHELGLQARVGYLVGHSQREGQVGEVVVVGRVVLVEVHTSSGRV